MPILTVIGHTPAATHAEALTPVSLHQESGIRHLSLSQRFRQPDQHLPLPILTAGVVLPANNNPRVHVGISGHAPQGWVHWVTSAINNVAFEPFLVPAASATLITSLHPLTVVLHLQSQSLRAICTHLHLFHFQSATAIMNIPLN